LDEPTSPSRLTPAAFAYAGVCVLALAALPHLEAPRVVFGAPHSGSVLLGADPAQGLLWGLGGAAVLAGIGEAATRWTPWGRRLTRLLARLVGPLHPADAILLAALSALGEELVFRGLLLPYLGVVASSAAFGLAHLIPRQGLWPWSLWAAAAGFALAWLALSTGGLLAPTVAHFGVNAIGLVLLAERSE